MSAILAAVKAIEKEARELMQTYFRYYDIGKESAYSRFFALLQERSSSFEEHLGMTEQLSVLAAQYQQRMAFTFTMRGKIKLQKAILDQIRTY